ASNNNLNMLEEAKFYALIHKGNTGDPTLITPGQAFYSATRAGALAQGREDCGLIKKGYRADLIVFDTYKPYMYPVYNLLTNLIYSGCGTDIVLTMVDGKVLYEDGKFPEMDMKALVKKSNEACRRILLELIKEREGD
ncbi:MAG: amidohydrolase family protein, partial [Firmicutes bacterium]|nr:amidohydrolase family protein [Bacillota bacterium]